jgi:hypothetical protein
MQAITVLLVVPSSMLPPLPYVKGLTRTLSKEVSGAFNAVLGCSAVCNCIAGVTVKSDRVCACIAIFVSSPSASQTTRILCIANICNSLCMQHLLQRQCGSCTTSVPGWRKHTTHEMTQHYCMLQDAEIMLTPGILTKREGGSH